MTLKARSFLWMAYDGIANQALIEASPEAKRVRLPRRLPLYDPLSRSCLTVISCTDIVNYL